MPWKPVLSAGGWTSPEVDAALDGVLVDLLELFSREVQVVQGGDILLELGNATCPDDQGGDAWIAKGPGQRQLGEFLTATFGDGVQGPYTCHVLVREHLWEQRRPFRG